VCDCSLAVAHTQIEDVMKRLAALHTAGEITDQQFAIALFVCSAPNADTTTQALTSIFAGSARSLQRALKGLVELGLLERVSAGPRSYCYRAAVVTRPPAPKAQHRSVEVPTRWIQALAPHQRSAPQRVKSAVRDRLQVFLARTQPGEICPKIWEAIHRARFPWGYVAQLLTREGELKPHARAPEQTASDTFSQRATPQPHTHTEEDIEWLLEQQIAKFRT